LGLRYDEEDDPREWVNTLMDFSNQISDILRVKVLRELAIKKEEVVDLISFSQLDQTTYAEQRGYIRALRDMDEFIRDVLNKTDPQD